MQADALVRGELAQVLAVVQERDVAGAGVGEPLHVMDESARIGTGPELRADLLRQCLEPDGRRPLEETRDAPCHHELPRERAVPASAAAALQSSTARTACPPADLEAGRGAEADELLLVVGLLEKRLGDVQAQRAKRRVPQNAEPDRGTYRGGVGEADARVEHRHAGAGIDAQRLAARVAAVDATLRRSHLPRTAIRRRQRPRRSCRGRRESAGTGSAPPPSSTRTYRRPARRPSACRADRSPPCRSRGWSRHPCSRGRAGGRPGRPSPRCGRRSRARRR